MLVRDAEKRLMGAKISMENLRGVKISVENLKGYEKFAPFSEKHSNRVSGLRKDRPLRPRPRGFDSRIHQQIKPIPSRTQLGFKQHCVQAYAQRGLIFHQGFFLSDQPKLLRIDYLSSCKISHS